MNLVLGLVILLLVGRVAVELLLSRLNRSEVLANRKQVPDAFKGTIDEPTYLKSVDYTLAKNKLGNFETLYDGLVLGAILMTGILAWFYFRWTDSTGVSVWAKAGFLFAAGVLLSLPGLPLSWYANFSSRKNLALTPPPKSFGGLIG